MMRNFCFYTALPAFAALVVAATTPAQAQTPDMNLYVQCSFYPQGKGCERIYQQALHDDGPAAIAVRDAFKYYARYLKSDSTGLTDDDKRYLAHNEIRAPFDLNTANLAGLHNVINDPDLAADPTARRTAVNGFIARAVQAELYCGISNCQSEDPPPAS